MHGLQANENPELDEQTQAYIEELSGPRKLFGWQEGVLFTIALCWSLFQLSLGSILLLNSTLVRSIHLCFAITIVFTSYPFLKKQKSLLLPR